MVGGGGGLKLGRATVQKEEKKGAREFRAIIPDRIARSLHGCCLSVCLVCRRSPGCRRRRGRSRTRSRLTSCVDRGAAATTKAGNDAGRNKKGTTIHASGLAKRFSPSLSTCSRGVDPLTRSFPETDFPLPVPVDRQENQTAARCLEEALAVGGGWGGGVSNTLALDLLGSSPEEMAGIK